MARRDQIRWFDADLDALASAAPGPEHDIEVAVGAGRT